MQILNNNDFILCVFACLKLKSACMIKEWHNPDTASPQQGLHPGSQPVHGADTELQPAGGLVCHSHVTFKAIPHLHRLPPLIMSEAEHRMLSKIKKAPEFPFSVIPFLHWESFRGTLKMKENFKSVPALGTLPT